MSQDRYELDVSLTGHTGTITTLQFSPDCRFLASGSNHGVLLIFSTSSWRPLKRFIDSSPITTILWHTTERYLLLCGCESGDLHFLNFTNSFEIVIDSTSYFEGPIRSLAFSPSTPTLAVGYGHEVSITGVTLNPYGLGEDRKLLPKSSSHLWPQTEGLLQPVAMSLHFLEKRSQLIVTYLDYGIICWDLLTLSTIWGVTPNACSIGRSAVFRDCDTVAASNPVDGVDWYSLSNSKLMSSSKIPISKGSSVSSLAYIDSDDAIVVGGLSGKAYIVDRRTFGRQELDHNDKRDIESVAFSPASGGRKLIATGTVASEGAASVNIWVFTLRGRNHPSPFTIVKNFYVKRFSWRGLFVYSTLLFLSYAWAIHFLTAG